MGYMKFPSFTLAEAFVLVSVPFKSIEEAFENGVEHNSVAINLILALKIALIDWTIWVYLITSSVITVIAFSFEPF